MPDIFVSPRRQAEESADPSPLDRLEEELADQHQAVLYNREVESETMPTAKKTAGNHRHVDEYSTVMAASSPTHNPFAAFATKPVGTSFDSQVSGEHVLLLLRQHLITQVKWIFVTIFLALIPFFVSVLPIYPAIQPKFLILASVGWYLFVLGFVLETFLNWFYNVYIITDERVIDVDFNSLLNKNISSAQLENIEDITSTTAGALGSIFNFGNIQIQTSAAVTQFEFDNVPQPEQVTTFLNELIMEEKQEQLEGRVR